MRMDPKRLMNEAPTIVGLMTSVIESGGSLDGAVRTVAEEGPALSRTIFQEAVRKVDTKDAPGLREALIDRIGRISDEASGYRQSMMLCISASDAGDQAERLRILREASDVALDSVRIMGEKYSASLNTPCMVVFGLGIMAPMILMSILPMLSMGGMYGSDVIDRNTILVITVVAIPAIITLLSFKIRRDNPFISSDGFLQGSSVGWSLLSAPLLFAFLTFMGRDVEETILLSVAPACIVCIILLVEGRRDETRRMRSENGVRDSVFELGNSMLGGDNFEKVVVDVLTARPECSSVGVSVGRELDLCRGDVCSALERAITPISTEVSRTLCDIHRCSMKDTEDAGRLAIAVGRQYQNESNIRKELDLQLKSMVDMMTGTAMFFAPLVLGMSVSMLGPLGELSGFQGMEDMGSILSVYLIELCAMISILTSSLGGGGRMKAILWRFCTMAPIALLVFHVCMGFQL